ncbi:MAG: diadenylate cyclase CdaA [Planctomycetota bacterium]|jgi:diadenylate cyclase
MPPVVHPIVVVLLLAAVLYFLARVLRRTLFGSVIKGLSIAMTLLAGAAIIAAIFVGEDIAQVLEMVILAVVVALVVIFQPEIRRALLRVGHPVGPPAKPMKELVAEETVRAVEWLSRDRWGALIAWERNVGLGELLAAGVVMDSAVHAETIVAIFTHDSPLHDGALVIRDDRIAAAACILPLGEGEIADGGGLRHRAALGLAEQTDALVIIVSEETGQVSVAVNGELATLEDPADLMDFLVAESSAG